jgi:ribosomal protein L27
MIRALEPRVTVSLDVKVWGLDIHGKPFVQHARTVNTSSVGARLAGIDCVRQGEIISMQHGDRRARCKVIWVGRDNTPIARQIGVFCVERQKTLFDPEKPDSVPGPNRPHIAPLGAGLETVTVPRSVRRTMPDKPASRRDQERYRCTGGVELRRNEGAAPVFGNLSDISLTGCYVESVSSLEVGSELLFMIRVRDTIFRGRAVVKASHHAVGMGLIFQHLAGEDQQKLEFLIGTLSGTQEMRPEDRRQIVPEDPVLSVRPLAPAHVRPPSVPQSSDLSVQITRTISELNDVEQGLVKGGIDPRLIAQFHDAVEHIRQTAWSAVQWVDVNASGGDPFEILPQLEAERMHMLRKLAHNVTADIDSASITRMTEGISELYEAIHQLYRGLRKVLMDAPEEPR